MKCRFKRSLRDYVIEICEFIRCKLCDEPSYRDLELQIASLEEKNERLESDVLDLEEENYWLGRRYR